MKLMNSTQKWSAVPNWTGSVICPKG
jgi:hypothetical protein